MARWLSLLEVSCSNISREREFVDWYETIHIADILETPGYLSGRLYRIKEPRDGRGQFLTRYEIETDHIDNTIALRRENRVRERTQGHYRVVFTVMWRDVLWKPITERVTQEEGLRKGERWINLVETNCGDPLQKEEFNRWYDNIHLTDVLETPGFLAAKRYERKEFVGGRGEYLTVYEIQTDNIDKTMAVRVEKRKRERGLGHYTDLLMPVWRDVLWRLITERTVVSK